MRGGCRRKERKREGNRSRQEEGENVEQREGERVCGERGGAQRLHDKGVLLLGVTNLFSVRAVWWLGYCLLTEVWGDCGFCNYSNFYPV